MTRRGDGAVADAVHRLSAIALADLDEAASLQERTDRKYIVTADQCAAMVEALTGRFASLEIDGRRTFGYESIYFDTPDFESYLSAARKRRKRFKVRTRSYLDSQTAYLEVKTKGSRGTTVKLRQEHRFDDRRCLDDQARFFVDQAIGRPGIGVVLAPAVHTFYDRTTLFDVNDVVRVTIDADLACHDVVGSTVWLRDRLIVETKSTGAPCAADRFFWRSGVRPVKVSKYCTCLAAINPHLPSNKWHRTIARYFGDVWLSPT